MHKERISSYEWLEHVKQRTEWFLNWFSEYGSINDNWKILHVGSGAEGEINFISKGQRFAIDPLITFYKEHFLDIMNKNVQYLDGRGENLPFEDNSLDLVISYNSLEYAEDPIKVLSEISRVMKNNGYFYLGINVKSVYGHSVFELIKNLRKQTDHSHSYTIKLIKGEISDFFNILDEKGETNLERFSPSKAELDRLTFKDFIKFYLLGQRKFMYHILANKTPFP
jgi:SAM-dependent methyltransferase